jgi:hypothetical protein
MTIQVLVQIILAAVTLIGLGVTIGMVRTKYVTKEECKGIRERCMLEIIENRRAVWKKVDQIYEWMVTGIIQIRRNDK